MAIFHYVFIWSQNPMDVVHSYGAYPGFNDVINDIATQPDGKSIYVGKFTKYRGIPCNRIVRLNVNGTIDSSFSIGTGFGSNANTSVETVTLQSDGKVLVGGGFSSYQSTSAPTLIRLNSDASIDNSFVFSSFTAVYGINNILVLPNGKIIVLSYNYNKIARLNSDGTLDNSFNIGTGFNTLATKVVAQSDGKIIIVGSFTNFNGVTRNRIIRLNEDGAIDNSFSIGLGFNYTVNDVVIQPDGKIVVCGDFSTYKGLDQKKIARLLTDGSIDNSFNIGTSFPNGTSSNDLQSPSKMIVDSNGKLIIIGTFTSYNSSSRSGFVKLLPDGSIDDSCNFTTNENLYSIDISSENKIIVGGSRKIFRILDNGTQDLSLSYGLGFNNNIFDTLIKSNGKYIVAGQFTEYQAETNIVVQFNADGTIDNSFNFNSGLGYVHGFIKTILELPNGQILVGGSFAINVNGTNFSDLVRVNTDGSIDSSFDAPYTNGVINALAVQSDGKIMVGGTFSDVNGVSNGYLIRLNTNGSLDNSFDKGTGFVLGSYIGVQSIVILSDGKMLIGGNFNIYNNEPHNYIMRLLPNGSVDSTFQSGDGFNGPLSKIMVQPNNKIIVVGSIGSYDSQNICGNNNCGIARLNFNGSLDSSFISTISTNYINDFVLQPDGKIIMGGFSYYIGGNPLNNFVRLNPDGSNDNSFNPNAVFSLNEIQSLSLFDNGNILVGGEFDTFNNFDSSNLILLRGGELTLSNPSFQQQKIVLFPNPVEDRITMILPENQSAISYSILDFTGKKVFQINASNPSINVEYLEKGIYFLKVNTESGDYVSKFIKK
ncbi:T9SS type A sorting domain-containing protein [Flavobacterium buctense]|uniref:T9SS type A sorting domain-containing protein n=1 Tax=Flavobacterium buctense TaxID=1648146 RepID=UPI00360AB0D3